MRHLVLTHLTRLKRAVDAVENPLSGNSRAERPLFNIFRAVDRDSSTV